MNKKGFTLIELLVVIAIIGILSAVVLASLNIARGKGMNAAVKADLDNIRSQTEVSYDDNDQKYNLVCTDPIVRANLDAAGLVGSGVAANGVCNNSDTAWAAQAPLKIEEDGMIYWCIDSTGVSRANNTTLGADTVCQ